MILMLIEKFNCPICNRLTPPEYQEDHHLIPRTLRKRNKYIDLPQIKEKIRVCVSCGDMIHKLFTEKEIAENYNTIEKILANEDVKKWAQWINKKPNDFSICMKAKKSR